MPKKFSYTELSNRCERMPLIVIYSCPKDDPEHIVARAFDVDQPTELVRSVHTLVEARALIPDEMICIPRMPKDDPCIVETWV